MWILILLAGGLLASRVIPVSIAKAKLKDHIVEISQLHQGWNARRITDSIHSRANELKLPLEKKNIDVDKNDNRMIAKVTFVTPLDFYVYTFNWKHTIEEERDIFYF